MTVDPQEFHPEPRVASIVAEFSARDQRSVKSVPPVRSSMSTILPLVHSPKTPTPCVGMACAKGVGLSQVPHPPGSGMTFAAGRIRCGDR